MPFWVIVPIGAPPKKTRPIGRFNVRSFITSLSDGQKVKAAEELNVRGIAFDGGYGIAEVLFSEDGGKNWRETQLGKDMGKYSFREWTIPFKPARAGQFEQAINTFKDMAQRKDGPLPIDGILMQLGRTYLQAGKRAEAQQTFSRLVEEYPESAFAGDARKEIDTLKKAA